MSKKLKELEEYTVITKDEDKIKIKKFKEENAEAKEVNIKEVNILVPIPPVANIYILGVYAALSHVLELLSEKKAIKPKHIKIKFLLMNDAMKDIDIIKKPIIKHYEKMIEGLDKYDGGLSPTMIKIRSTEFKSLTGNILVGLNDVKTKEIVLKSLEYQDIEEYPDNKSDDPLFKENMERFREAMLTADDGIVPDNVKRVSLYADLPDCEDYPFGFLLQIVNHFIEKNDKKVILVISDVTRNLIDEFFTKYYYSEDWSSKTENIAFADYPDPSHPKRTFKFEGGSPPAYLTILSEYLNEPFEPDELWFAGMLGNYLKCREFRSEYEKIIEGATAYMGNIEKLNELAAKAELSDDDNDIKKGREARRDAYISIEETHRKKINENITTGFLSIQENIAAQLEFIL